MKKLKFYLTNKMSLETEITFTSNLLLELNASKKSTIYSPASILNALAMVYVGSDEETARQIAQIIAEKGLLLIQFVFCFLKSDSRSKAQRYN